MPQSSQVGEIAQPGLQPRFVDSFPSFTIQPQGNMGQNVCHKHIVLAELSL